MIRSDKKGPDIRAKGKKYINGDMKAISLNALFS